MKTLTYIAIFFALLFAFNSCKKGGLATPHLEATHATIKIGQTDTLELVGVAASDSVKWTVTPSGFNWIVSAHNHATVNFNKAGNYTVTTTVNGAAMYTYLITVTNIGDSRKVYFVDVPLNLVFKPNQYLSIKAGPVFSLPVKQVNGISTFQTGKLKKDSLYYVKVTQTINATNYTQSINMGLSLGASAQTGRFIFDAAYIRGLKGLTVSSGMGSYTANNNSFLFTIGFKLNKLKK